MLDITDLHQYYGGSHILRGISLQARPGQVTALLGRNGVGKTTLLRCLMGLLPLRTGSIAWNGERVDGRRPDERVARGFGYVPQGREIFPRLTVEENLRIGAASRGNDEVPLWIDELFPVLRTMRARRGGDLSGGQQQQLAFGRALMAAPRLLILDEPTEGIQPSIIEEIGRVIRRLAQERGLAILLCEQYYDFAKRLADTYAVMSRGEIVASGPGSEMDAKDVRALIAV
ncbi:MAG TPA: urea ABC transporter ATP-binding subunit UrtE [Casimicrobiaceae bacterium]|jgi:urea transport system ATP-binding protein|nr:urea ABC transporter ATP-binding subunit UrtE [Casimicrobiaceae bacterium]